MVCVCVCVRWTKGSIGHGGHGKRNKNICKMCAECTIRAAPKFWPGPNLIALNYPQPFLMGFREEFQDMSEIEKRRKHTHTHTFLIIQKHVQNVRKNERTYSPDFKHPLLYLFRKDHTFF